MQEKKYWHIPVYISRCFVCNPCGSYMVSPLVWLWWCISL